MKANEVPEKIFLHPDIGGREFIRPWLNRRVNQESVEYIRTDAFIEKATEWLHIFLQTHLVTEVLTGKHCEKELIEKFKEAMKL